MNLSIRQDGRTVPDPDIFMLGVHQADLQIRKIVNGRVLTEENLLPRSVACQPICAVEGAELMSRNQLARLQTSERQICVSRRRELGRNPVSSCCIDVVQQ